EDAERFAPERRMLGGMAEDRDHFPFAPADREAVAVHHAPVAPRHRRHAAAGRPLRTKRSIVFSRSKPPKSSCAAWAERNSEVVIQKGAPVRSTSHAA